MVGIERIELPSEPPKDPILALNDIPNENMPEGVVPPS